MPGMGKSAPSLDRKTLALQGLRPARSRRPGCDGAGVPESGFQVLQRHRIRLPWGQGWRKGGG